MEHHSFASRFSSSILVTSAFFTLSAPLHAADLIGVDFGGILYDVNTSNGNTSNPRNTGVNGLMGITQSPDSVLYAITAFVSSEPNSLLEIDPETGNTNVIGSLDIKVNEGDLDVHPLTGDIYGIQTTLDTGFGRSLFTIDPDDGSADIVGPITNDASDFTAMAFAPDGTLYVLDTNIGGVGGTRLLTVDPADAQILTSVNVNIDLGFVGGMDFEPGSGTLYVADGGNLGTDTLYTLNPDTGVLTSVGPLGLSFGLAGLEFFVCRPAPANDNCADAALTFLGIPTPFSTECATTDGPPHGRCEFSNDPQVGSDVWFKRTATCTGLMTVSTCGTAGYDTKIAVYDGCECDVNDDRLLGCNDDAPGCGLTSELTVSVVEGQCYLIRIGGYLGDQGSGTVDFQCLPSCPADFDGDGDVDTADLLHLLGCWAMSCGDIDGDNDTDTADLLALLAAWGDCP